jgi:hypothetical protein
MEFKPIIRGDVISFLFETEEKLREYDRVFIWDLDKTYLDTKWETIRGLIRTAFEKGSKKKNIPGAKALVQSMQTQYGASLPLFFVSASPPQMIKSIYEKLTFDGLKPLGFLSKDNLKNVYPGKFKFLNKQIGYKLQALMELRLRLNKNVKMVCFGDDSESDAVVYSLFSDLCSHRITDREAKDILLSLQVLESRIDLVLELRDMLDSEDPVERVYIHLEADTDPEYYDKFGRRLFVVEDTFQTAVDLYQYDFIKVDDVVSVAKSIIKNYKYYSRDQLEKSYDNLFRRNRVSNYVYEILTPLLKKENIIYPNYSPSVKPLKLLFPFETKKSFVDLHNIPDPWIADKVDYLDLI